MAFDCGVQRHVASDFRLWRAASRRIRTAERVWG